MVCVTWDGQISFLAVLIYFDVLELIALFKVCTNPSRVELQRFETHVSWWFVSASRRTDFSQCDVPPPSWHAKGAKLAKSVRTPRWHVGWNTDISQSLAIFGCTTNVCASHPPVLNLIGMWAATCLPGCWERFTASFVAVLFGSYISMIHHYPHVFACFNSFFTTVVGQEVGFILHTFLVDGFQTP